MAVETVSLEMVDTREDVLVSCFCFLKAVAKNNIQAKRRFIMIMLMPMIDTIHLLFSED